MLNESLQEPRLTASQFCARAHNRSFYLPSRTVQINQFGMRISDAQVFRFNETARTFEVHEVQMQRPLFCTPLENLFNNLLWIRKHGITMYFSKNWRTCLLYQESGLVEHSHLTFRIVVLREKSVRTNSG